MGDLLFIYSLAFITVTIICYQFFYQQLTGAVHLPPEIKEQRREMRKKMLDPANLFLIVPAVVIDWLINKAHILPVDFLDKIDQRLMSAGKPMVGSQFLAFKFLTTLLFPLLAYTIFFDTKPSLIFIAFAMGFLFPDFWLNNIVRKRQRQILRDLPSVIELMNICVCSGLDFMVAVNRVTREFRACPVRDELSIMIREIQMGSTRRDALRNLAKRINTSDVTSFVLTLLQADRMGTPIGKILKSQADEIRIRRFQRGEEQALKAPIKLLFPLLFFIMPVVLIVVAGPILIQFVQGGNMFKF